MTFPTPLRGMVPMLRRRVAAAVLLGLAAANTVAAQPTRFGYAISNSVLHVLPTDPATGTVSSGISVTLAETGARHLAVDPTGRYLWVSHGVTGGVNQGRVTIYRLRGLGERVTHVATLPFLHRVDMVAFEPSGRFAYVASHSGSSGRTSVFRIAQDTGVATPVQTVTANPPRRIEVDPTGRQLIALTLTDTAAVYDIDPAGGQITLAAMPLTFGSQNGSPVPSELALHPTGRFVSVSFPNRVQVFPLADQVGFGGHHVPVPTPAKVVVHPTGRLVFAASEQNDVVYAFRVLDIATGFIELADSVAGVPARDIALDPSGRFLYAAGAGGVATIGIDLTTGDLRLAQPQHGPAGLVALRMATPSERYLFPTVSALFTARTYPSRSDVTTGALAVGPAQDTSLAKAAVDPANRFVVAASSAGLTTLRIDPATGRLSPVATFSTSFPYHALTFDPAGRFVFATCPSATSCSGDTIHGYRLDETSGELQPLGGIHPFGAAAPVGTASSRIVFDGSSRWAYATQSVRFLEDEDDEEETVEARLVVLALDDADGVLAPLIGIRLVNRRVLDIAVDPVGPTNPQAQILYVLSKETNADGQIVNPNVVHLSRFAVNLSNAQPLSPLSEVDQTFGCDGCTGGRLLTHPTSRFAFVATGGGNGGYGLLYSARTDVAPGSPLTLGQPMRIPDWSGVMAGETAGRYLYLGTTGGALHIVAVDPSTGALVAIGRTTVGGGSVSSLHSTGRIR
jgi:6-phosphogluconolactonase (cycloisomerase 2 family)